MAHNQFELLRQRRFLPFFLTAALGAFNDNVFRNAMLGLIIAIGLSNEQVALYANLAPALFILPYFLFSATAGQIAEKYEKAALIRITTAMEIVIMSIAAVGFMLQQPAILLVVLFLTGLQSALFGPVKYSILPQVLKPEELTGGNGLIEMVTSISILLGMITGIVLLMNADSGATYAAVAVVALAITGHLVSRAIPRAEAAAPELKVSWIPVAESLAVLRLARTAQLANYAELQLGAADGNLTIYLLCLALFSIGTGIGSLLCEKLSARTVEIGLVPLGALGMTAFCVDLYFARSGLAPVTGLALQGFLAQPGSLRIMADLTGIGLFAGFYVVPLFALVQSRTPRDELSRVIAALNIQNALFIVTAAVLCLVALRYGGWNVPQIYLATGVLTALVTGVIFSLVPEFFMRFLAWIYVTAMYRVRVVGVEDNVPDEGAALLVCNHVSYMDALILSGAIPRPIRFVMYYKIFKTPGAGWIFKAARAIPIAGAREDAALMELAFAEVDAALAEGELVCIFPEGALTCDGEIATFKSGVERILAKRKVPVVPLALKGMWASMWSRRDTRLGRLRLPRRLRAAVGIVAGPAIAAEQASAELLEAKVRALRGDNP